jgi:chemotaxis protein histidine kinase CheA
MTQVLPVNGIRARILLGTLILVMCAVPALAMANAPNAAEAGPGQSQVQALFVQTSKGVVLDEAARTLTLTGLNPATLFFANRPDKDAGHLSTGEFLQLWGEGDNSFRVQPPNATLSVVPPGSEQPALVVVTLMNPRVSGDDLTYDIILLDGGLPERAGPASLFIDILGVWRRAARRTAVVVGTTTAAVATTAAVEEGAAAKQQAAAQEQAAATQAASAQSAAAASQAAAAAAAAASQAAAAAATAAQHPASAQTPQQQLEQLQNLYKQGLITESDYNAAKAKILAQIS